MDDNIRAVERLREINLVLNAAENEGNTHILEEHLCTSTVEGGMRRPLLAIRRATGVCDGADTFLAKVREGGDRLMILNTLQVQILGRFRALVTCIVETKGKRYHNVRLFVRDDPNQQQWKLLGWANEEIERESVQ